MNRRAFIGTGLATAAVAAMPEIPVQQVHISEVGVWGISPLEAAWESIDNYLKAEQEWMVRQIAFAFDMSPYMLESTAKGFGEVGESEVHTTLCQDPADGTDGNRRNGKGE